MDRSEGIRRGSDRTVAPKKRNRKGRASAARRLVNRIESTSAELRDETTVDRERVTLRLDAMHGDKRAMRRDIYADAPQLEGQPVYRR